MKQWKHESHNFIKKRLRHRYFQNIFKTFNLQNIYKQLLLEASLLVRLMSHNTFLSDFSFKDTDNSQDSRGRARTIFIFLYYFHYYRKYWFFLTWNMKITFLELPLPPFASANSSLAFINPRSILVFSE